MSDEELIEAYTQGRVSRRVFVRRLVAGGLSVGAAVAYSNALASGTTVARLTQTHTSVHTDHHTSAGGATVAAPIVIAPNFTG